MANDDKPDTEASAEHAPKSQPGATEAAKKSEPPAAVVATPAKSEPPAAALAEPAKKGEPPAAVAAAPAKKSEPPAAVATAPAKSEPVEPDQVGTDGDGEPVAGTSKPAVAAMVEVPAAAHGHAHAADHGLAHTMPIWMLGAVLGALMVLTFLTVSVTNYDLGSEGNLVVGMVIATIKAGLVITFFMHVLWDKKFHLILFLTAVLFVVLFLSMSFTDRDEYQGNIDRYQSATATTPK